MPSTVVTRVLRAMRNYEFASDGDIVGMEAALVTAREHLRELTHDADASLRTRPEPGSGRASARSAEPARNGRPATDAPERSAGRADVHARLAVVEQRLDAAFDLVRTLRSERDELRASNARLAAALAEAERKRAREPAPAPASAEPGAGHLLFVAGTEGYRLVERQGPPPAGGTVVELTDEAGTIRRHLVVRVGDSGLPGAAMRCAYLLPAD